MELLPLLFSPQSAAWSVFVLVLVAGAGLALGNIKFLGINLGIAGVMFSGIASSYFGVAMNPVMLGLLRDFGLILFVYSIGTQVGPGFFSSFRKDGIRLNLMAVAVMLSGVGLTLLISRLAGIEMPLAVGMYAGASTNTPALAAAQQTLAADPAAASSAAVGCALGYPGGILGIILVLVLLKYVFRRELRDELAPGHDAKPGSAIVNLSVKVENRTIEGLCIKDIPALRGVAVVVSRIYRDGALTVAHSDTKVRLGDILLAVGRQADVDGFAAAAGSKSEIDLRKLPSRIIQSRVVVTHRAVLGRRLEDLDLEKRYNVTATRVSRADVEFLVPEDYVPQFADNLVLVGDETSLAEVSALFGNSPKDLNHPRLIPVFIGIGLGVLLGCLPIRLPGLSAPIKLGLAGGPLIMAILLSYVQTIGSLNWYMPPASNLMLRELGIVMFLACVGLESGGKFVETIMHGNGLQIIMFSAVITVLPALVMGFIAKRRYKTHFMSLCGAIAGSTTNPPALAFSDSISPSSMQTMAYATVYPLAMIMRIISAQLLVLFFMK